MIDTCLVLAKRPLAGRVKTRLTPPLSAEGAAAVAAAALAATCDAVDRSGIGRRVLVVDEPHADLARPGWEQAAQCVGGLDARITDAFVRCGRGPTVLVGMDTPQLAPDQLTAFDDPAFDAALGLAGDGGFWLLALRDPSVAAQVVPGVPMSTSTTGAAQAARLVAHGLRVQTLAELRDVDTFADAEEVAALLPGSDFAAVLHSVSPVSR